MTVSLSTITGIRRNPASTFANDESFTLTRAQKDATRKFRVLISWKLPYDKLSSLQITFGKRTVIDISRTKDSWAESTAVVAGKSNGRKG